jgi:hypothetical protein
MIKGRIFVFSLEVDGGGGFDFRSLCFADFLSTFISDIVEGFTDFVK